MEHWKSGLIPNANGHLSVGAAILAFNQAAVFDSLDKKSSFKMG